MRKSPAQVGDLDHLSPPKCLPHLKIEDICFFSSLTNLTKTYEHFSGMFSEDEDSRDSGLGDMDCGPSSLKGAFCGDHLFILDEEMEDLALNENTPQKFEIKSKMRKPRVFGDISNG